MTKSELIKITAKKANVTQQQAGEIISTALEVAADALASGDSISIQRFGVLEVRERKQRVTHNLQTGEQITIRYFDASSAVRMLSVRSLEIGNSSSSRNTTMSFLDPFRSDLGIT